jgi:hypothetical protein
VTKKKRPAWEDKTPSEAIRLKSGAALNLLDIAATATRLARAYDQAERGDDGPARAEVGLQLIKLGGEMAQAGWAIGRDEKRRKKR